MTHFPVAGLQQLNPSTSDEGSSRRIFVRLSLCGRLPIARDWHREA
jgi:hypothetical protein